MTITKYVEEKKWRGEPATIKCIYLPYLEWKCAVADCYEKKHNDWNIPIY